MAKTRTDKSSILYIALKSKIVAILLLFFCSCLSARNLSWNWWPTGIRESVAAGGDSLLYIGSVSALSSSGQTAPTWLQANRNGEISSLPHSGNISLGIIKPATRPNRWFDYDGGVVLTGRLAGTPTQGTGYFSLLYAHVRLYIFDITAGVKPQTFGAGDEELSSGCLLVSNNAHPMPRISIGFERWTPFPGLFGYVEVKGGLTHGWMADNTQTVKGTLLHHKYIGGRIGGKLPVNISYEFHHVAQWGGHSQVYGDPVSYTHLTLPTKA